MKPSKPNLLTEQAIHLRQATLEEDSLVTTHFYQMWQDNGVPADAIQSNWREIILKFIDHARQELAYQAFIAEIEGKIVGSVSCQCFAGLYPNVLSEEYRKYGYLWGVYVEPLHRGQGVAKALTSTASSYLRSLGCTRVILHASPFGQPVYERLGFCASNEMQLDLLEVSLEEQLDESTD